MIPNDSEKQTQTSFRLHRTATESPSTTLFESHCHDNYELLYVLRGKGRCFIEGMEYEIFPNELFLIPPLSYHYVRPSENTPYERAVINFYKEDLLPQASAVRENPLPVHGLRIRKERSTDPINGIFDELDFATDRFPNGCRLSDTEKELWTRMILTKLFFLIGCRPRDGKDVLPDGLIPRATDYINRHLTEDLTLEKIAKSLYVSKYYLCRNFLTQTGVTVIRYRNAKRIALAKQLLADGIPAALVADQVGFRDYSVFFRNYKKITGTSPTEKPR